MNELRGVRCICSTKSIIFQILLLIVISGSLSSVAWSAPPANDDFANAVLITDEDSVYSGRNSEATLESDEPDDLYVLSAGSSSSVWWRWVAPTSDIYDISTEGSDFDTVLAVYTGTDLSNLTLIYENDDTDGLTSQVTISTESGTEYFIAVDGYGSAQGNIQLMVISPSVPPSNDNFADAIPITELNTPLNGSNVAATLEPGEYHDHGQGSHSVWWKWTAPTDGPYDVSTIGSDFNTVLAIYTGTSIWDLVLISQNDDWGGETASLAGIAATAGTEYFIAVDGYGDDQGNVQITVIPPPSNDNFADAIPIITTDVAVSGTNLNAILESGEPDHASYGSSSVWWKWTAPDNNTYGITTTGSNFDTVLAIYTGDELSNLVLEGEDNNDGFGGTSIVTVSATAGTTYYIAVDGLYYKEGIIQLTILSPPVNDNFADAIVVTDLSIDYSGNNIGATLEPGEPDHGGMAQNSVWWKWVPETSGAVDIDDIAGEFTSYISLYSGESLPTLEELITATYVGFYPVTAGTTYYIAINGYNGSSGTINLSFNYYDTTISQPGSGLGSLRYAENCTLGQAYTLYGEDDEGFEVGTLGFRIRQPGGDWGQPESISDIDCDEDVAIYRVERGGTTRWEAYGLAWGYITQVVRSDDGIWSENVTSISPYLDGYWDTRPLIASAKASDQTIHFATLDDSLQLLYIVFDGTNSTNEVVTSFINRTFMRAFDEPHQFSPPRHLSIAVDSGNNPHIIYSVDQYHVAVDGGTEVKSKLFYAYKDAGSWVNEVLIDYGAGTDDAGLGTSIAVAPDGTIAVASTYLPRAPTGSPGQSQLRYLVKNQDGSWSSSVITDTSDGYSSSDGQRGTGLYPYLRFDSASRPHIVFTDHASEHTGGTAWSYSGQMRYATRTAATSGTWQFQTVVSQPTSDAWLRRLEFPVIAVSPGQCGEQVALYGNRIENSDTEPTEYFEHLILLGNLASSIAGDLDGNYEVGLSDAIIGLQILTSELSENLNISGKLQTSDKIGLPEVIYIMNQ